MRRFKLNKTHTDNSKEQEQQNQAQIDPKVSEQKAKIEALLTVTNQPEQLTQFMELMQCPIGDYDEKLADFIPTISSGQLQPTSIFVNHDSNSLAEATLITNFQLLNYSCQTVLGTMIPLLVEQFKLNLMQKNSKSDHLQQLEVVNFGKELSSRLTLPFQACSQSFVLDAERIFKSCLEETNLAKELEQQELTLGRIDYVEEDVSEKVVLDHVKNYPIFKRPENVLSPTKNVDKYVDHQIFFQTETKDQGLDESCQEQQVDRIIEKLKQRKAQLLQQLNE